MSLLFILIGCSYSRLSSEIKEWHGPITGVLNVNPDGFLQTWICSHCVVLENSYFYMYPLQRVFGLRYLTPHWLVWYGHFLDITGYYSNHILTCFSKTTSSSALWTYNLDEFGNPQYCQNWLAGWNATFWQVKNLVQSHSHLNVSNSINVTLYPLLKFLLNIAKML